MRISKAIRLKIAREVFTLAYKIKKRDHWFIGGFLGEVEEEWEKNNSESHSKIHSVEAKER